ncbi:uncharacterized protein LOC120158071 [Hibiscus syriacus]|uniref:uncharacterized protein LOC120158071 n=1 Tax=Hibiscus syriacus TaxID=106335 RepID=UPI001923C986|nr:uncharacterized protein LOC120158071 [Hibiscus syriacus]
MAFTRQPCSFLQVCTVTSRTGTARRHPGDLVDLDAKWKQHKRPPWSDIVSSDQQLNSLSLMLSGSNKRDQHGVNGQQSLANDNQVKSLSSMPSGSKRRGRELVSDDSSKPKGKGKMKQPQRRRTIVNGESAPTSKAVPLSYEDRIKEKSVGESAKILTDRVSKRTESVMALLGDLFLAYDKMPWTARAQELKADSKAMRGELKRINRYIINILVKCKKGRLTEEAAKKRLVGAHNRLNNFLQKIENAREGLKQSTGYANVDESSYHDLEKTRNLDAIFAKNMDFSSEYLREKLASEIPFDIKELDLVDLHSKFSNFKSRLYDKENNKVDIQDFEGLQEALNRAGWGKTPNHLEQIAMEVETAIGKQINNPCIRVLLSAAIKEMKDLKVDEMERDMCNMFKKWAATFNYAKENGFSCGICLHKAGEKLACLPVLSWELERERFGNRIWPSCHGCKSRVAVAERSFVNCQGLGFDICFSLSDVIGLYLISYFPRSEVCGFLYLDS